jgi:sugar-specific transcriptional regulator TrmB
MTNVALTVLERTLLRQFGLSKNAVALYEHLIRRGPLTAKQAADITRGLPSAEYRLFKQLENLGLIRRGRERPVIFRAVPKEIGLPAAYAQFRSGLEQLLGPIAGERNAYYLEVLVGRQALYEKYIQMAARSRHEICIYAIGIAYSKELERSQRAAVERDVRVRHVLQQIRPSNFHVAHKWQKLGVRVRYAPSERGFHFMLFDKDVALVSFSDPNDTDDRLSILTNNPAAVRLFEADFEHIWSTAQKVTV